MNRKKIILIIGLVILLISVPLGVVLLKEQTIFHLGAQDPNQPANVSQTAVSDQSATITWTTKNPVQSLVSYGISPTNLTLIQPETAPAINHQINLTGLLPGSNYFFVIKVEKTTFDNNGQPYTFTTKTKEIAAPTLAPTGIPTLAFTEEGFQAAMGTSNSTFDLNKDGVVNTLDLMLFRQL